MTPTQAFEELGFRIVKITEANGAEIFLFQEAGAASREATLPERVLWDALVRENATAPVVPADELTRQQVIDAAEAAGLRWIHPDDEEGGFPGGFDMATLSEVETLIRQQRAAAPVVPQPAAQQGEAVAEVIWHDPTTDIFPPKPGKVIDASIAFMESADIGTKLYTAPPARQAVALTQADRRHLTLASPEMAEEMERLMARIVSDPDYALGLLVGAGICNAAGQLTPEFGGPDPADAGITPAGGEKTK